MSDSTSAPSHFRVAVGGCSVELEAATLEWATPMAEFVGLCEREEQGAPIGLIRFGGGVQPQRTDPPDIATEVVHIWTRSDPARFAIGTTIVELSDEATVSVDGDARTASMAVRQAMPVALGLLLARADRWTIHGAAVLPAGGPGAVVALGPTGAGKSTAAAAALRVGWPILADDQVVIRWKAGIPQARGLPRPLALPAELGDWAGRGRPVANDPRGRLWVPTRLAPGWFPIRAVVMLAHGHQPMTTLERASGIEVLRSLWAAHFPAALPSRMAQWFPRAGRLARGPAWRMHLGTDADTRLATIVDAIEAIVADSPVPAPT